jgi:hypothetical protein
MVLNKKVVYQWCQWLNQLFVILFTAFACAADLRLGFAFAAYELIRSIYVQMQAEEKLIEEFDHEKTHL